MTPSRPRQRIGPHWRPSSWSDQRFMTERLIEARRGREITKSSPIGFCVGGAR